MTGGRGSLLLLLAIALPAAGWAQSLPFPQGVAAGDVTHDAAIVWARTDGPAEVRVELASTTAFTPASASAPVRTGPEGDFIARLELTGLAPGRRYFYRFISGTRRSSTGTFITAPPPDRDAPFTLVWGADTSEEYRPFRILQGMRTRGADLFLYLGDTIYADFGGFRAVTLEQYRQKYRINREDVFLREHLAAGSAWVIWDDHEVENNFDGEHIRLNVGLRAFREYWPIRLPADGTPRLYRNVRYGRLAEIIILDTRQYRSPVFRIDGPDKTMLGRGQKAWLLERLLQSDALIKFVVSSVPLRHHGADSWEGYAHERNEILRFIAERRIANVVFLVADVHYAALLRHSEGPYEAIAGPLGAILSRVSRVRDKPETLWSATGRFNYGWMRVARNEVTLEWRDDQDRLMHAARIPVLR